MSNRTAAAFSVLDVGIYAVLRQAPVTARVALIRKFLAVDGDFFGGGIAITTIEIEQTTHGACVLGFLNFFPRKRNVERCFGTRFIDSCWRGEKNIGCLAQAHDPHHPQHLNLVSAIPQHDHATVRG